MKYKIKKGGEFPGGPVVRISTSLLAAHIQSPVRDLISHKSSKVANLKKKKKKDRVFLDSRNLRNIGKTF